MYYYDSYLFCEIIESVQGIQYLRETTMDGIHARWYQGLYGNAVMIDMSYEELTVDVGKGYLKSLGLKHLIESMFPENGHQ